MRLSDTSNESDLDVSLMKHLYRLDTVNSEPFVGKVLFQIKWKFQLHD